MFPHPAREVILRSSKSVVAGQCSFLEPKETHQYCNKFQNQHLSVCARSKYTAYCNKV